MTSNCPAGSRQSADQRRQRLDVVAILQPFEGGHVEIDSVKGPLSSWFQVPKAARTAPAAAEPVAKKAKTAGEPRACM